MHETLVWGHNEGLVKVAAIIIVIIIINVIIIHQHHHHHHYHHWILEAATQRLDQPPGHVTSGK